MLEHRLRNISQPKITISNKVFDSKDGIEAEVRVLVHKGSYYMAVKGKHNWHYFKESNLD